MFAVYSQVGFPGGSDSKASACSAGDPGSIPGSGRSPGEGNGNPLQDSCLENPMDREAWWATVHGVAKSWTRLNDFTFTLGSAQQGPLRQAIMYDYNESECRTVMSDPLRPHGLYSSWNPPGQNTGVVAYPFSSGSSRSRNRMRVSCIAGIFFTN